jgi:hypothetical protein
VEREDRWTYGAALRDAQTRNGNVRIHPVVWIGNMINSARFDREYTIVTSYYYIGSNTFIMASPAPYTCRSPI